jgi:predicted nucleic acid-binding protein
VLAIGDFLVIAAGCAPSLVAAVTRLSAGRHRAVTRTSPPHRPAPISGDPDDDQLVAAALSGGAEVLISGDQKHVLPLREVSGTRIPKPQDFVAEQLAG